MKSHEEFELCLLDLGSGGLSGRDRAEVLEHAADCRECSDWLETYARLEGALTPSEGGHPSADSLARWALLGEESPSLTEHLESCPACRREVELSEAVVSSEVVRPRRRLLPVYLAAAAALVAAAIGIPLWLHSSSSPSPQPSLAQTPEASVTELTTSQPIGAGETATLRARSVVTLAEGFSVGEGASLTIAVGSDAASPLERRTKRTGT